MCREYHAMGCDRTNTYLPHPRTWWEHVTQTQKVKQSTERRSDREHILRREEAHYSFLTTVRYAQDKCGQSRWHSEKREAENTFKCCLRSTEPIKKQIKSRASRSKENYASSYTQCPFIKGYTPGPSRSYRTPKIETGRHREDSRHIGYPGRSSRAQYRPTPAPAPPPRPTAYYPPKLVRQANPKANAAPKVVRWTPSTESHLPGHSGLSSRDYRRNHGGSASRPSPVSAYVATPTYFPSYAATYGGSVYGSAPYYR
ncbi:hypothetical protein BV25DRAFT_1430868 [Artomyces pyxidatus]|uniref:Uncharacterized protein n=1 Tax=Artomyces pyxidatus TaxID=48021 RepID=A0ACB8SNE0_9AGAM|nr:hypothetical protein BV25DRAFT_1430868 [Artomyces pyxidatus]